MKRTHLKLGKYKHVFGYRDFWLDAAGIAAHKHIIGKSGKGKSKLVAQMIVGLFEMGQTFALIDPHSELAHDVLALLHERGHFPSGPNAKIFYVPFWKQDRFLPFNVLNQPNYTPHAIAEHMKAVAKRIWHSLEEAPTFANILYYSVLVLIYNSLSLNRVYDLLTDKRFRDSLLDNVPDPQVLRFFHQRFDQWREREAVMMRESTLNRIDLFTAPPLMRFSLGQYDNLLNFRRFMDKGISGIYDIGRITADEQAFLGSFILHGYETAAKSRTGLSVAKEQHVHMFVDEFPSFTAPDEKSFTTMFSQTRKMGLFLNLINQNWSQIEPRLRGSMSNCEVHIAFGMDYEDAVISSKTLGRVEAVGKSHGDMHERESVGMPEQWQELVQEIEDLHRGYAYVRKPIPYYVWPLMHIAKVPPLRWLLAKIWHRHPSALYRVKTLHYPELRRPVAEVEALKDAYAEKYMTRAEDVIGRHKAEEQTIFVPLLPKKR